MLFYSHLTLDMRRELEQLHRCGTKQAEIALRLGVSRSTVSRELKRNGAAGIYDAEWAHKQAIGRKQRPGGVLPTYPLVIDVVITRLMKDREFPFSVSSTFLKDFEEPRLPVSRFTFPTFFWQKAKVRKPLSEEQKEHRSFYLKLRNRDHIIEYILRSEFRYYVTSRLYETQRQALLSSSQNKTTERNKESKNGTGSKQTTTRKQRFRLKRKRLTTLHHEQRASSNEKFSVSFKKWKPPP